MSELQHAGADHEIPADLCEIDRDLVEAAGSILGPFLPFHIFLTILQFIGSIKMIYMGQSTEPIFFDWMYLMILERIVYYIKYYTYFVCILFADL